MQVLSHRRWGCAPVQVCTVRGWWGSLPAAFTALRMRFAAAVAGLAGRCAALWTSAIVCCRPAHHSGLISSGVTAVWVVVVFDIGAAFGSGCGWVKQVVFIVGKFAGVRVVWVLASWRAAATVPSACPGHGE